MVLKNIFKHAKLVTHLLDAFDPLNESSENGVSADTNTDPGASSRCGLSAVDKKSLRGFVINASNAIRLQVRNRLGRAVPKLMSMPVRCLRCPHLHSCAISFTRINAGTILCLHFE